ncbi:MAG: hypothetical protein K2N51_12170 [Lachnospiraceae bacterium]|nr:hypothetical protein [Lachnospiraceae bacterium]
MIDIYEKRIINDIETIQEGCCYNLVNIDKSPKEIAYQILQKLLEWACQPQNMTAIAIARKKIREINKDWLNENFLEVIEDCIDLSDEWEYRRLLELVVDVLPEMKGHILELGIDSENEEIREIVEDYKEI